MGSLHVAWFRADGSAMGFNELTYDGEPEPGTASFPTTRGVRAKKALKNTLLDILSQPGARIDDPDLNTVIGRHSLYRHRTVRRSMATPFGLRS